MPTRSPATSNPSNKRPTTKGLAVKGPARSAKPHLTIRCALQLILLDGFSGPIRLLVAPALSPKPTHRPATLRPLRETKRPEPGERQEDGRSVEFLDFEREVCRASHQRTVRPSWRPRVGIAGAPVLGIVFGLGWTPCLGPTLVASSALSVDTGTWPAVHCSRWPIASDWGFRSWRWHGVSAGHSARRGPAYPCTRDEPDRWSRSDAHRAGHGHRPVGWADGRDAGLGRRLRHPHLSPAGDQTRPTAT